jgi:hypothetical protein
VTSCCHMAGRMLMGWEGRMEPGRISPQPTTPSSPAGHERIEAQSHSVSSEPSLSAPVKRLLPAAPEASDSE